jgi:prepilin-type N-terminal cleavage/methylation domain-containing protein
MDSSPLRTAGPLRTGTPAQSRGFSLIELLVSTIVVLVVMAGLFRVLMPQQRAISVEADSADLQQRLRVAASMLTSDLLLAGAGPDRGARAGPLHYFFAPLLPRRLGSRNPDQPGTFKTDTITLVYAAGGAAQTTIAQPMPALSADAVVALLPGCPISDPACGFKTGMNVLIFDDTGSFDMFTVTSVTGASLHLEHNFPDGPRRYAAGSTIVEATIRTFYLKADASTDTFQLVKYDGGRGADVPVIDHLVELEFDYFGEPQPPVVQRPLEEPLAPWTSYGPRPPAAGVATTGYPPGENCVFALAASTPVPRLADLGGQPGLVQLTAQELSDGPWCPDSISPNRYDADLLRVRKVAVRLRLESQTASFRGAAGWLFKRAGTSDGGGRLVPDQQVQVQVAPRNLNLAR